MGVDVFGVQGCLGPGPPILIGGMPGPGPPAPCPPGPPGPPGPILLGGGPLIPGAYAPGPMGPMPGPGPIAGPRGPAIRGFMPGGPCQPTKSPSPWRVGSILLGMMGCPGGPLKSLCICGILTPGRGPPGYRDGMNGGKKPGGMGPPGPMPSLGGI